MRKCKVCLITKEDSEFYGKAYTCKRCICESNSRKVYERNITKEPDLEGEIWKPYPSDSKYKVSNLGRVRGIAGKIIKASKHHQGYLQLNIRNKKYLVHRLVAETFIPNPDKKETVNHINAIKSDNKVENLEWATMSENVIHAFKMKLRPYTKSMWESLTKGQKISKQQVNEIKEKNKQGKSQIELSVEYNVSRAQICRIINGKSRSVKQINTHSL